MYELSPAYETYDGAYSTGSSHEEGWPSTGAETAERASTEWADMRAALPGRLSSLLGYDQEQIDALMATVPEERREPPMVGGIIQHGPPVVHYYVYGPRSHESPDAPGSKSLFADTQEGEI